MKLTSAIGRAPGMDVQLRTVPAGSSEAKNRSHISSVHGLSRPTRAYIFVCSMSHRWLVVHVITGSALSVNMRKSVKKCASCVAPARLRDADRAADESSDMERSCHRA